MGELVFGLVLLGVAFFLRLGAATVRGDSAAGRPIGGILRILSYVAITIGVITVLGSTTVVINAGEVGVRHAFGTVDPKPLLPGIRLVTPWSSIERFTTREEQYPFSEDQIHSAVRNAIRKGVRDGMVQYSINDISKRTQIARTMESLVDSALVTQPRAGGPPFRIATVTAFFLRDLQPPAQVVQAINNKIAQEQQVETERHR